MRMLRKYGQGWAAALLFVLAFGLRLWGLNFGLPFMQHPDEPGYVAIAQNIFKAGDLNPHFFNYPSLFFYLNALVYYPYFAVGAMLGVFHSRTDILYTAPLTLGVGLAPMPTTFLLGRLLSAIFGTLIVGMAMLNARMLTQRNTIGLMAGGFVALSWDNVMNSRFITPDIFVAFFAMLALCGSILVFQQGKLWQYIFAGVACGLVATTKYNGGVILVALVTAHLLRTGTAGLRDGKLYLAGACSALAFVIGTPFSVLDPQKFLADLNSELIHYRTGHLGAEGDSFIWYLEYLAQFEGPVIVAAALVMVAGVFRRSKPVLLMAAFPILYFLIISTFIVRNERTILPMVPFLSILASVGFFGILEWREKHASHRTVWMLVGWATFLICVIWSGVVTVSHSYPLTVPDSRKTATSWIAEHVQPGASIVVESYSPYVDVQRYSVQALFSAIDHPLEWYKQQHIDYVVFGQYMFGRFYANPKLYSVQIAQYETLFRGMEPVRTFLDGGYEVRIYRVRP